MIFKNGKNILTNIWLVGMLGIIGFEYWFTSPYFKFFYDSFLINTKFTSIFSNGGAWFDFIQVGIVSLAIVITAIGVGNSIRIWLSIGMPNWILNCGVNFGLGIFFIDLFFLGVGLNGIWYRRLLIFVFLIIAFFGLLKSISFFRACPIKSVAYNLRKTSKGVIALSILGMICCVIVFLIDLTPETFYDSLVYHLAVPWDWLLHHQITYLNGNFFSNFPYGGELFLFIGVLFRGSASAKFLNGIIFFLTGILAGGWAYHLKISNDKSKTHDAFESGILACSLIWTLSLLMANAFTTQVECIQNFFILLFVIAISYWLENLDNKNSRVYFGMASIFLSMAVSIKYTTMVEVLPVLIVVMILMIKKISIKETLYQLLILLGIACIGVGPWIFKNTLFVGNPFFPYFSQWFHGVHLSRWSYHELLKEQREITQSGVWVNLLEFFKKMIINKSNFGLVNPILIMLIPTIIVFKTKDKPIKLLLISSIAIFVILFSITHIFRFMISGFILFYIYSAIAIYDFKRLFYFKWIPWLLLSASLLVISFTGMISANYFKCLPWWLGGETRIQYLETTEISPYAHLAHWVNHHVPATNNILIVGDARGFYYKRPFIANSVFDHQILSVLARKCKTRTQLIVAFKKLGINDIVVNESEGTRVLSSYHHYDLTSKEWYRLDHFLRYNFMPIYNYDKQMVYQFQNHRVNKKDQLIMDPILFFSAPVYQFILAIDARHWNQALIQSNRIIKLYPFSAYWAGQQALLLELLGRFRASWKAFKNANQLGQMSLHEYLEWKWLSQKMRKNESNEIKGKMRLDYSHLEQSI
jgi:hypothetical protein